MELNIITKEDLNHFRLRLLEDIKALLEEKRQIISKPMKSKEVRDLLEISSGTLQNLRISGKLKHVKIGGTYFYKYHEIMKLLELR